MFRSKLQHEKFTVRPQSVYMRSTIIQFIGTLYSSICINLTLLDYSIVYVSIPTLVGSKCKSTVIDINIYTRVNGHVVSGINVYVYTM